MPLIENFLENRADRVANRRDWSEEKKAAWLADKEEREGWNNFKRVTRSAASIALTAAPFGLGTAAAKAIEASPLKKFPVIKEVVEENVAIIKREQDGETSQVIMALQELLPAFRLFQQGMWLEGSVSLVTFLVAAGWLGPKVLDLIP